MTTPDLTPADRGRLRAVARSSGSPEARADARQKLAGDENGSDGDGDSAYARGAKRAAERNANPPGVQYEPANRPDNVHLT